MIKLHVGCGKRNWPGWYNIDTQQLPHVEWNDATKLPFADGIVDLIYASHLIAYWDRAEIVTILKEWLRVLKPGGVLRLATPDYKKLCEVYAKGSEIERMLGPLYGKMSDPLIYHRTVYDYHSLTNLLRENGFTDWEQYDHRFTEHPNTGDRNDEFDDQSAAYIDGVLISLNVQCYKGGNPELNNKI